MGGLLGERRAGRAGGWAGCRVASGRLVGVSSVQARAGRLPSVCKMGCSSWAAAAAGCAWVYAAVERGCYSGVRGAGRSLRCVSFGCVLSAGSPGGVHRMLVERGRVRVRDAWLWRLGEAVLIGRDFRVSAVC